MTDVHTHLTDHPLNLDLEGVLSRARNLGVEAFIIPAYRPALWAEAMKISEKNEDVYFALGRHPLFLEEPHEPDFRLEIAGHEKCLAIGEAGLDYRKEGVSEEQKEAFRQEVAFAIQVRKPLIIHCVRAYDDLYALLREQGDKLPAFVLHSASCSAEQLRPFLDLGAYVSFSGGLTRSNGRKVRALAVFVPEDRYLVETDSPYIGTATTPPPLVSPANLPEVAAALATLRREALDHVMARSSRNARTLFRF